MIKTKNFAYFKNIMLNLKILKNCVSKYRSRNHFGKLTPYLPDMVCGYAGGCNE